MSEIEDNCLFKRIYRLCVELKVEGAECGGGAEGAEAVARGVLLRWLRLRLRFALRGWGSGILVGRRHDCG